MCWTASREIFWNTAVMTNEKTGDPIGSPVRRFRQIYWPSARNSAGSICASR